MAYVSTESPTLGQGPKHFGAAPQGYSPRTGTVPAQVQSPQNVFPDTIVFAGIVPVRGLYLCGD